MAGLTPTLAHQDFARATILDPLAAVIYRMPNPDLITGRAGPWTARATVSLNRFPASPP